MLISENSDTLIFLPLAYAYLTIWTFTYQGFDD